MPGPGLGHNPAIESAWSLSLSRSLYNDGENKKAIGKFKDESPDEVIESFVGIRSKCYTFITKNNVVKKAKGANKVLVEKHISFE